MCDSVTGEQIKQVVRETYGDIARRYVEDQGASPTRASCCGPSKAVVEDTSGASCCRIFLKQRFYTPDYNIFSELSTRNG